MANQRALPPKSLEKYRAVAARAGADGSLCRSLRLGTRGRLSGRWRGVLESFIDDGRARLHDRKMGWLNREKGGGVGVSDGSAEAGDGRLG